MSPDAPPKGSGKIEFIEFHRPGLEDGDYEIVITQEVHTADKLKIPSTSFPAAKSFTVAGERFGLNPADIHAVFPPEGSLGEHSNVLPHVILNRSTLPWEREAEKGNKDAPWLALLLFDDEEKPRPRIVTLNQLQAQVKNPKPGEGEFPKFALERAQHAEDLLTVIDVRESLLKSIMPEWEDLKLLTHVRAGKDEEEDPTGDELAVVIGNRLPRPGKSSTVHLVSVENRFNGAEFDYQSAGDLISLVSLKSWSFACEDEQKSFKKLLENLNQSGTEPSGQPGALRLSVNRLDPYDPQAAHFLDQGYVLLPHYFRQGDKTASWYRGPLIPGEDPTEISLPVRAADELLRYDPNLGMFDASYAAAWELGRLLALQDKGFSTGLFGWKRSHVQELVQTEQRLLHPHLSHHGKSANSGSMPDELTSWLEGLSLLRGVPFNYLVPDDRMLPPESIRFFEVDGLWVECLLDGAFSIGRVTTSDHETDRSHAERGVAANPFETVTGLLLRSEVVRGWPGLLVDAYYDKDGDKPLPLLRMERLSPDVLICLFEGSFSVAGDQLNPQALTNPTSLIHSLLDEENLLSTYLAGELAVEVKSQLHAYQTRDQPNQKLLNALVEDLNRLIAGPSLYDQSRFEKVQLSPEIRELIATNPIGAELLSLNRALLKAAYPREIAEGSRAFGVTDFEQPAGLAHKLKDEQDSLSNYLYRSFAPETCQLLDEYENSNPPDRDLINALIAALNRLIAGPSLYEQDRFADIQLSVATKALAVQNPQGMDLLRLNRILLEAAYPRGIASHRVEIHQKPEALHFGLDKADARHPGGFYKKLRDSQGRESEQNAIESIPWRPGQESARVIKIVDMARQCKSITSAQFALQMIEGVEKVVFTNG